MHTTLSFSRPGWCSPPTGNPSSSRPGWCSPPTGKTLFSPLLWLAFFTFHLPAFTQQAVNSEIREVTVFLEGAQVIREASAAVPQGRTTLRFPGLSALADPNSVQLSGTGKLTILSVTYEVNYLEPPSADAQLQQLEAERDRLEAAIREEKALLLVYEEEEALLQANRQIGGDAQGLTVTQLRDMAAFYRERLREIKLEKLAGEAKAKQLEEELAKIRRQLNEERAQLKAKASGEVVVAVDAPARTNATFRLGYLVRQAGWEPAYDLRVDDIAEPVQLDYRAWVRQNSGEDWSQVQLTLSTGNPEQSGTPPMLEPWWLSLTGPPVAYGLRSRKMEAEMAAPPADAYEEVIVAAAPTVTQEEQTTTVAFRIAEPYDIPTDNQRYAVAIAGYEVPANYEYFTAPKLEPAAFLRARIVDWEQYNLLSGTANLFFEGTFLGQSYLDLSQTGDTLDLGLGRDAGIIVKRTKARQFTDKQLIGNKQTRTVAWEIELRNTKKRAVTVVLEDQYPLSTTEAIEVNLEQTSGAAVDAGTGKLRWVLQLAPGATEKVSFRYAVKYPKKERLILE